MDEKSYLHLCLLDVRRFRRGFEYLGSFIPDLQLIKDFHKAHPKKPSWSPGDTR